MVSVRFQLGSWLADAAGIGGASSWFSQISVDLGLHRSILHRRNRNRCNDVHAPQMEAGVPTLAKSSEHLNEQTLGKGAGTPHCQRAEMAGLRLFSADRASITPRRADP